MGGLETANQCGGGTEEGQRAAPTTAPSPKAAFLLAVDIDEEGEAGGGRTSALRLTFQVEHFSCFPEELLFPKVVS